jgi:purine-binding chemotaxis protein CheW
MMPAARQNETRRSTAEQKRVQLVTFRLDRHRFAVPVEQVWRVESLSDFEMTRVPGAPDFLEGLINLRGRVVPTIDLKKRLDLAPAGAESAGYPPKARLLIVEMEIADQKDEKVAMIVDTVNDIRWFAAANLHPPPPMIAEIDSQYVHGVMEEDGHLWLVLELRQVLSMEERRALQNQAGQAAPGSPPPDLLENIPGMEILGASEPPATPA